ncbi:MAG: NAD-dependent epimerase/dehydratase family protein [Flavobacteriales bacterium]|nr:NAD-dependent epimerase/dehydratase family protein [Flavobacteriales bacterium]
MTKDKILIIGASGQIGTELVIKLRSMYGNINVIASDVKNASDEVMKSGPYEVLDVMNESRLHEVVKRHGITQIYLLAALLSATAEKNMELGWALNMRSLSHVLDQARFGNVKKVYWPSSIAVFGSTTPQINTSQHTIMEPNTVYGITKQAGERWCEYYHQKFNIDVRSLRYPGLISWKTHPGGGTTDYAVQIFHQALKDGEYESFLTEDTTLPMMYMPDAVRATIELMEAPSENLKIRSSYNVAGISFNPKEISEAIKAYIPKFKITYNTDERQAIANTWPKSIDDSEAQKDWGWKHHFDLDALTKDMLLNLKNKYN